MAEPSQSFIVNIPSTIGTDERDVLGREIIRFIRNRTKKGLDINNRSFTPYSTAYKDTLDFENAGKSNSVNLTLTGEMLNTMEVISSGTAFIRIGFEDTDSNDKASWNRTNGRSFMGINQKDLNLLISRFTARPQAERFNGQIAESVAASFLKGLFGGQ